MVIRKMKDKCKDAARMRREKERTEFVELSKLLPLPSSTTSQLDKASIIRLTSSYLRMRSAFPNGLGQNWGTPKAATSRASSANYNARVASSFSPSSSSKAVHHFDSDAAAAAVPVVNRHEPTLARHQIDNKQASLRNQITHSQGATQQTHIRELGSLILQTLDGFVFALHRDGKIMYISETASVLLGLPQIDLTGSSIFEYVHPADRNDLIDLLGLSELDRLDIEDQLRGLRSKGAPNPGHLELGRSFCVRMKCILPKRNAGLVHNGYKAIHCSGYLKVKCASRDERFNKECQEQGERWDSYALVAVGHSLLPSASIEVKLNTTSFMFRAHLDMKMFYIETPASSLLGHQQADFIGHTLYQFIHVADSSLLEQAHRSLLSKSQVVSKYLRLMRPGQDAAGFVWMQMCACLINNPRSMPKSQHIVGVCWIIGDSQLDESRLMLDNSTTSNDTLVRRATNGAHTTPLTQELGKSGNCGSLLMVASDTECGLAGSKRHRLGSSEGSTIKRIKRKAHMENVQIANRSKQRTAKQPSSTHRADHSHFSETIGSLRRPSEDTSSVVSSIASSNASSRPPTATAVVQMTSAPAPRVSCPCLVSTWSAASSSSSASSTSSSISSSCPSDLYSPPNRYDSTPTDGNSMISPSADQQPLYLLHPSSCRYVDPPYTTAYNHHYDSHATWTTAPTTNCHPPAPMDSPSSQSGLYYQHHEPASIEARSTMPHYEQHVEYTGDYHEGYSAFCDRSHQGIDHIVIQTGNTACFVGGDHSVS